MAHGVTTRVWSSDSLLSFRWLQAICWNVLVLDTWIFINDIPSGRDIYTIDCRHQFSALPQQSATVEIEAAYCGLISSSI